MKASKVLKVFLFVLSFVAISITYQNCGPSGNGGDGGGAASANSNNGDIIPIPNTKTASVQRASRVLDNLVSCLGTGTPSDAARNVWNSNRGTISEEGLANSMTQPMAKSLVSVSAEVCNDLVNRERGQQPAERKIFLETDLDAGGVNGLALENATKRIARSCWGRNATADEISMVVTDVVTSFSGDNDNGATTRNKLIYLCTAMAASFAAFEM